MMDRYGVDAFRYFLMAEMVMGQDASFTEEAFVRRYNADLANDLGNLLNRVVSMTGKYCGGTLPAPEPGALEAGEAGELLGKAVAAARGMKESLDKLALHEGVAGVMDAVRATNRFIETRQPWTQARAEDKGPLGTTLYAAADTLRLCAALLTPCMPSKMAQLRAALGMADTSVKPEELERRGVLASGVAVGAPGALFPRVEAPSSAAEKSGVEAEAAGKKKPGAAKPAKAAGSALPEGVISYDEFAKVQLRTAVVMNAEPIEGAVKLLKLNVMMDKERRQIVAGIALYYKPEELVGKTVVVVANLAPVKLRGVESQGMLLAASCGERLRLVTVDGDLASGAVVK